MKNKRCYICGNKEVVFKIEEKNRAILNGIDYTDLINKNYKKGEYFCKDYLFK